MTRKNKLRYQSKGNPYPVITLTGKVSLRHGEEDDPPPPEKGDLQIYSSTEGLLGRELGDYESMGFEGYLKADVFDGKGWKPLSLEEFFPGREYYFGKRERPWDTYRFCLPAFQATAGARVMRTYREHYVKTENAEEKS